MTSVRVRDVPLRPTRWSFAAIFGLVGAVLVALVVMAFVWPAATLQAHDLPVGVSGPDDAVSALEEALAAQDPAPFALEPVDSQADAETRIRSRELYGAILLGDEPQVLVATAAAPASAQALRGVATQLQAQISSGVQAGLTQQLTALVQALKSGQVPQLPAEAGPAPTVPIVTVTDVVPLAPGDRTGAGLAASVFPLVLGGMLGGILLSLLVQGVVRRLVGLLVFGVVAGAGIMLVLQTWFQLLEGNWWLNAAVAGLGVTATAALVIGLAALLGPPGIAIGAVITMFIGNPIAGASAPPQFLPGPWGQIGQWFVPGASASLLRSVSYFPEAPTASQWLTLLAWTAIGVLLALVGHSRQHAELPPPEQQLEPSATDGGAVEVRDSDAAAAGYADERDAAAAGGALRRRSSTTGRRAP